MDVWRNTERPGFTNTYAAWIPVVTRMTKHGFHDFLRFHQAQHRPDRCRSIRGYPCLYPLFSAMKTPFFLSQMCADEKHRQIYTYTSPCSRGLRCDRATMQSTPCRPAAGSIDTPGNTPQAAPCGWKASQLTLTQSYKGKKRQTPPEWDGRAADRNWSILSFSQSLPDDIRRKM